MKQYYYPSRGFGLEPGLPTGFPLPGYIEQSTCDAFVLEQSLDAKRKGYIYGALAGGGLVLGMYLLSNLLGGK